MTKDCYGWKIGDTYYCQRCGVPAVATAEPVYGDEADTKRCCHCAYTLRAAMERPLKPNPR